MEQNLNAVETGTTTPQQEERKEARAFPLRAFAEVVDWFIHEHPDSVVGEQVDKIRTAIKNETNVFISQAVRDALGSSYLKVAESLRKSVFLDCNHRPFEKYSTGESLK